MEKQEYKPGTILFLSQFSSIDAAFAVVFEENFWKERAAIEDPWTLDCFNGLEDAIPARVLGTRINMVHSKDVLEPSSSHVQHYVYTSNSGHTWPMGIDEVEKFCQLVLRFGKGDVRHFYYSEVAYDIKTLKMYLAGGYNVNADNISHYQKLLLQLFEKGIPK